MSDITNLLSTLSDEQIQDILAVSRQAKEQRLRDERRDSILPEEIIVDLENTTSTDLKRNLTNYARNLPRYDGGNWTLSGAVNKELLPAIRQYKLDATQTIEAFYKGGDRLRTAARATIEIFEDLQHLVEQGGNREDLEVLLEKQRRLAVYQLASGKQLDNDARTIALKAARLPESIKHIAEEADEGKDLVVDSATLERINKAKFEESLLRRSTNTNYRGNFHNRGRGRGYGLRGGFNNRGDKKDFSWKGKGPRTEAGYNNSTPANTEQPSH
jgi:hypothetical protein